MSPTSDTPSPYAPSPYAPSPYAEAWDLDPKTLFLNHGSFGACPRHILELQSNLQREIERQPVKFLHRELEARYDEARGSLAEFLHCSADDLCFVTNATSGVNTVLRSLRFEAGDELLVTNQEYNASRNVLNYAAATHGAKVVVIDIPFPIADEATVTAAVMSKVTDRTKLLLIDHIVSQTGIVLPIQDIVQSLNERGIDTFVDGAHAPGQLDLNLDQLGAAYYTGNLHKWLCAPKGAAMLHVRADRQELIRPNVISHGANSPRTDRSRFRIEADWLGTHDPTPWLCIPECIRYLASLTNGGWDAIRKHNHDLVLHGRQVLCEALEVDAPCPPSMVGSLASIPMPDGDTELCQPPLFLDSVQTALHDQHNIEVPIMYWPAPPKRFIRISAQLYNAPWQYASLAQALQTLL